MGKCHLFLSHFSKLFFKNFIIIFPYLSIILFFLLNFIIIFLQTPEAISRPAETPIRELLQR